MTRPRTLPNGDLTFPIIGTPPLTVPGYYQDDGDPWLWHLDVEDCQHRLLIQRQVPCRNTPCGYREVPCLRCKHFNKEITLSDCVNCPVPNK